MFMFMPVVVLYIRLYERRLQSDDDTR